jgi:hypothetical protein
MTFFEKPLRFRGLLALAEEDGVASQLRDEELRNAAAQIRLSFITDSRARDSRWQNPFIQHSRSDP